MIRPWIRLFSCLIQVPKPLTRPSSWSHLSRFQSSSLDCRRPAEWFPLAREIRRKIVAHLGPTNSGKTHAALSDLRAASSGIYAAPLRLLAVEVGEQLRTTLPTSIITGQEVRVEEGSQHTSCTIEMANIERHVEVAVIDEIQLLADETRGWAFTRALLGISADTLHVCGSPEILPLLSNLVEECGDELVIVCYQRLCKLVVQNQPLYTLSSLQEGDCLIAFSRRAVHSLKREVLRLSKTKSVSVIYGGLPPLSRKQQASAFNSQNGEGLLVATDAIGMGLNLKIKRIVFSALEKFDGKSVRPLRSNEMRQIAGRAGRYQHNRGDGNDDEAGHVTTLHQHDLGALHDRLKEKPLIPRRACILPRTKDILTFADKSPRETPFSSILETYMQNAATSDLYFIGDMSQCVSLARLLQSIQKPQLPPIDLMTFCISPTDPNDAPVAAALLRFAKAFTSSGIVPGDLCMSLNSKVLKAPSNEWWLKELEATHRAFDLYLWFSHRYESQFPDSEFVDGLRLKCSDLIQEGLERLGKGRMQKRPRDRDQDTWSFQFHDLDLQQTEFENMRD